MFGRRNPAHEQSEQPLRLPIDVLVSGDGRGMPDLALLTENLQHYTRMRSKALVDGSFEDRVLACWGLIARDAESLDWCRRALTSESLDDVEDGAGVLGHIGVPADWASFIEGVAAEADEERAAVLFLLVAPERALELAGDEPHGNDDGEPSSELLQGHFAPFTNIIYFVRASYDEVVKARRQWRLSSSGGPARYPETRGSLENHLALLEPFAMPSYKSLFVETNGGWTAVFSQGSDLSNIPHFAKLLDTRVVRTASSPHVVRDGVVKNYGGTSIWITDPDGNDGHKLTRTIQASRQSSRWQWDVSGEPLSFEDTSAYERRVIRERFDLQALNAYCQHLGILRNDVNFYGPRATLEEVDTTNFRFGRSMPSWQWRAENS